MPSPTRWTFAVLVVVAAACSSPLEKPPVEQRYYTLDATRAAAPPAAAGDVLAVRRFRASPGYEGRELVFATAPGAFRTDFYNVFFASPAAMLGDETREWLDRSGLFRAAVASTSQADARYALEGALSAVYGEKSGGTDRAVLEAQFLLIDVRAANAPILFQRQYRQTRPVADGSATALVGGLNEALAAMLAELEADLAPIVRPAPVPPAVAPAPVRAPAGRAARR